MYTIKLFYQISELNSDYDIENQLMNYGVIENNKPIGN